MANVRYSDLTVNLANFRVMPTIRSELPLKAELHLTRIQRFDETTIGIQAVIGAEQNWVGVISCRYMGRNENFVLVAAV